MMAEWDMFSPLLAEIQNCKASVQIAASGDKRIKFLNYFDFHPFRNPPKKKLAITKDNFSMLKMFCMEK